MDPRVHRRARRVAALGGARPRRAARSTASPPSPAATTRWTATSAGSAPTARCARSWTATASTRTIRSPPSRRATTAGVTDEFIEPVVIDGRPRLDPERDTAIFFNFRPDRARQLSEKLGELGVDLTTMTRYRDDFDFPVVFPEHVVENTLAEVLSAHGIRQLHSAETEKYAHVTYFLNGGREEPFAGEERILVDSPRDVPSYDHKPEMSAPRGRRPRRRGDRRGRLRLRRRQLREPGHGRPHGRDSGRRRRPSRRPTRASGASSTRSSARAASRS